MPAVLSVVQLAMLVIADKGIVIFVVFVVFVAAAFSTGGVAGDGSGAGSGADAGAETLNALASFTWRLGISKVNK